MGRSLGARGQTCPGRVAAAWAGVVGGEGALCCSSGPAEPRRESAVPAFPRAWKPSAHPGRCPCSRTGGRAPTAGASETLHLTEDSVRSPPREQASMLQPSHSWPPSPPPIRPDWRAASRSRPFSAGPYLTSFGSRPVSLRIFSSTFFRLSLAFSSCSCKVLTATAIFSLQQASRLLHRPRQAVSRRQTRED